VIIRKLAFVCILMACISILVQAQEVSWPRQVVRFIVPTSAGGGTDFVARLIADHLRAETDGNFIVEDRPGGGGNIGTEIVAHQDPNGYTFLVTQSTHTTNVGFFKKLPYDPAGDFDAVAFIGTFMFVLCANPAAPAKSIHELIELLQTKGDMINYGSPGFGTPNHLAMELFKTMTDFKITHVPYKGTTPLIAALLANEVNVGIVNPNESVAQYVATGTLRCLASTGESRSPFFPDVPTIAEAVPLPGYAFDSWYGILTPAGTPRPIVDLVNRKINHILLDPEVVKRLATIGVKTLPTTPEKFTEIVKAEVPKYLKIAKDANITPQ
jgi:tripartite-type tricarboxylate transporter receptor subunit TctC